MYALKEKHFTVDEIAEDLQVSKSTIQRLFNDEPGTIDLSTVPKKYGKRHQRKLSIPQSVFDRVMQRRRQK